MSICLLKVCTETLRRRPHKGNIVLDLMAAEYKMLCLFMQNPGSILTKEKMMDKLWDEIGNNVDDNTLAVCIRRLRTKIEADPGNPQMLVTIRGMGYKWNIIDRGGEV